MKLRTAIIDDEVHCIETLAYDLRTNHEDQIEIIFTSRDSVEAVKLLKKEKPDLVFLDIEMPGLGGFDILELLDDIPMKVVFTTAHSEYAIKAVGFKAEAYLLKPIEAEELEAVIEKIHVEFSKTTADHIKQKLPVPTTEGIDLVPYDQILYCQSNDNYTKLFLCSGKKILASKTLKYFGEQLPEDQFFRIHKSYIVNLLHLKQYLKTDGGVVSMGEGINLPVSRMHKEKLLKLIHNNR